MKLRKQLTLIFLTISLVSILIASLLSIIVTEITLLDMITNNLKTATNNKLNWVETLLEEHKQAVKLLSIGEGITELLNTSEEDLDYNQKLGRINKQLSNVLLANTEIFKASIIDKNGLVIASTDKSVIDLEKEDVIAILKQEGIYVKDPHLSKGFDVHSLDFALPIISNGTLLGGVVIDLNLTHLHRIMLDSTGLGKTEETYLINKEKFMITPSRFINDTFLTQKVDTKQANDCFNMTTQEHLGHVGVTVFYNYRGARVLGTHAHIPKMNWCLLTEIETSEAFMPIRVTAYSSLFFMVLASILTILIIYFITKKITKPILKLKDSAVRISKGDFDVKIKVESKGEIGELEGSFKRMTNQLNELIDEARERARKEEQFKTKVLEEAKERLEDEVAERAQDIIVEKNKLDTIISNIGDGLFVIDSQKRIIKFNFVAEHITGLKASEVIGKKCDKVLKFVFEDTGKPNNFIEQALHTEKTTFMGNSTVLVTKNEKRINVEDSAAVLRNVHGKKEGVVVVFRDITKRKKAEKELIIEKDKLQESEERYRSIYSTSKDAIMILEPPKWWFTAGNPATVKMFNTRTEKIFTSLGPWKLSPKYQPDGQLSSIKAKKMISKAMKEGSNFFEWNHKRYKGEEFPATVLLTKMRLKGKEVLQATVRDVTERKLAEKEYKKLSTVIENSFEAIALIDLSKTDLIRYVNPAWENLFGYKSKEVVNKKKGLLLEGSLREPRLRKKLSNAIKSKSIFSAEMKWKHKSGRMIPLEVVSFPIFDKNNEVIIWANAIRNITERKRVEQALRESEEKYRGIFEISPEAILLLDKKGELLDINERVHDWLGYKPKEIIGMNFIKLPFLTKKSKLTVLKNFTLRMLGKNVPIYDVEFISKKGKSIIGRINAMPIRDKQGNIIGDLVLIAEVTKLKKAEELRLKHKQEEEVNRLRNLFLMRVSHELRHPIVPILGYANVMLEENPSEIQRKYLEKMVDNANRLKELINKVLSVTTLEIGKAALNLKKTSVKDLINKVVSDYETRVELKGLRLIKDLKGNPKAMIDEVRIKETITNLLDNALKFTDKGSIKITLKADKHNVIISVEDTGKGMSKDELDNLVNGTYELESGAYKEMYQGLKLGLILVNLIVKAHRGELIINSKKNKGTKIMILLPKK